MTKTMRFSGMLAVMLGLAVLSCAGQSSGADHGANPSAVRGQDMFRNFELGVTYTHKMSKIATLNNSSFAMNGVSVDGTFWFRSAMRNVGLTFDISEDTANGIAPNVNLSQFSAVFGPRVSLFRDHGRLMRPNLYIEELQGWVHAYNSVFPVQGSGSATASSANSFALQTGGGMNLPITHGLGWRVIEADYIMTHLPNYTDSYQGAARISTGIDLNF
jgi:hypothetical protein